MRIAAAAPTIPWTDLVHALLPNGRTLDYTVADGDDDFTPTGVLKQSFVAGLYASGQATGSYQPTPASAPGDFSADLTTWFARVNAGGPYTDPVAQDIVTQIRDFRSPYYLPPAAGGPAPLFIANGWTDDLFPPQEALRLYNRDRATFPANPIAPALLRLRPLARVEPQARPRAAAQRRRGLVRALPAGQHVGARAERRHRAGGRLPEERRRRVARTGQRRDVRRAAPRRGALSGGARAGRSPQRRPAREPGGRPDRQRRRVRAG